MSDFRRRVHDAFGEDPFPHRLARQVLADAAVRKGERDSPHWLVFAGAAALAAVMVGGLVWIRLETLPGGAPGSAGQPVGIATPSASPGAQASTQQTPPAPSVSSPATPGSRGTYLSVTPSAGLVGSRVLLRGHGCNASGQPVVISFEGVPGSGTVGSVQISGIPVAGNGDFQYWFTIPAQIDSIQGRGGGPTQPGRYYFTSKPARCFVDFTVA